MSEILGTLFKYLASLLGVATVVGVLYLVFGTNKASSAMADMTLLQTNVQSLYNVQSNFTSLTPTVAINGKLAPASMISGTSLINPWGTVNVGVNAGNASRFDITESSVPQDACAKMIVSAPSVVALTVNGAAQTVPMDAGAATGACTSAAANTLVFTFAR